MERSVKKKEVCWSLADLRQTFRKECWNLFSAGYSFTKKKVILILEKSFLKKRPR